MALAGTWDVSKSFTIVTTWLRIPGVKIQYTRLMDGNANLSCKPGRLANNK